MGRYMPTVCQHGVEVDAGDFGPCQNCDDHPDDECPNFTDCPQCDELVRHADRAQEIGERVMACHRSGRQVDAGPYTFDRAGDFYTWLTR